MKKIPVNVPLKHDGSITDVINDFINTLQSVTGGDVELDCDLNGNITIYYEVYPNKHNPVSEFDQLFGQQLKSRPMSEPATIELRADGENVSN